MYRNEYSREQSHCGGQRRSEPVPLRHYGNGKRPRDGQLRIIESYRYILSRVVNAVNPIRHIRWVGEGLKPVRAAGLHIKRDLLFAMQLETLPAAVRRRRGPQIHHNVEDRAEGAPHEFGLSISAPHVQAAHHATRRAGQAVLNERSRFKPGRADYVCVEGAAKEPALVHMRGRPEQQRAGNPWNRTYLHEPPLPLPTPIRRWRRRTALP